MNVIYLAFSIGHPLSYQYPNFPWKGNVFKSQEGNVMNSRSIGIVLIVLITLSFASCVGPQLVVPTQGQVMTETKVKVDSYAGTWQVITPRYYGGHGSGYHLLLRAGGKGKIPEYFQIYVSTSTSNWLFLERAIDIEGNHLPVRKISTDVTASSYGASVHEDIAIDVAWSYLKAHTEQEIKIKIYGTKGTIEIMIDPQITLGFLDKVDEYLGI